ncbi:MAG: TylF/MycF/NovP-related O-methyltransferase [Myxococcota bacterium]|nr:TylF/MycF/NovP-related O-methyltransferase [Myxococcota bacterium]
MKNRSLMNLFLALPRPLARGAYALARATVLRDARLEIFDTVFGRCAKDGTTGDYLEFGVYRGTSFVAAHGASKRHGLGHLRMFAFDSFGGLPNSEGVFNEGDFVSDEDLFRRIVDKAGVPSERVHVVRGLYDDTCNPQTKQKHGLERAAVIHVDCDLYTSTKVVLDFCEELLQPGTVLMFDDWYAFGDDSEEMGEAKAFDEWPLKDCFDVLYDRPADQCKGFVMTRPADGVRAAAADVSSNG